MDFRISPFWWPVLGAASPLIAPLMIRKNRRYKANREAVAESNQSRLDQAGPLDLPELDFLELTVLVEEKTADGFYGDAGVSYLFRTDRGALLFDVGFGPERPARTYPGYVAVRGSRQTLRPFPSACGKPARTTGYVLPAPHPVAAPVGAAG